MLAPCAMKLRGMECRPVIKRADDCSNFDDYSSLGPMKHDFELSSNEQATFSGF